MGDKIMAAGFGLFGLLWAVHSSGKLTYWNDFAPGSGFLPFWLGLIIMALAGVVVAQSFLQSAAATDLAQVRRDPRRVMLIVLGLLVCLALLHRIGFVVTVGAYLAFLIGFVERRTKLETVAVSLATTVGMWVIFKAWLKIPLPQGPWGF